MRRTLQSLFYVTMASVCASAQTTQGLISGRVVASVSGQAVAGAEIRCESYGGGPPRVARSGDAGYFVLPLLSPGLYKVRVAAAGYQPREIHHVEVQVAGRLEYEFRLRNLSDVWETGQYRSVFLPNRELVLTFYGPDVDTSRSASFTAARPGRGALEASVSQVVDPAEVSDLPLAGRDVYTTLILQPGVTAGTAAARGLGLSVAGQRPTTSNFLLDGSENNNYLVTGPLAAVAPEAVQEYRISTNNYSAEYGRTAGVVANAVTRAGGNEWHGAAYFYARNDGMNGNDFQRNLAGLDRPGLREAQPGFQVGGAVLRSRLFSSTSFEWLRSRGWGDPVTVQLPTSGFLSYLAGIAPYNASAGYAAKLLREHPFPVPQGRALSAPVDATLPNFVDRRLALERIDYAVPGSVHRLMARVAQARQDRPDFIWSPYQGFDAPLSQNTLGIAAALTSTFNSNITNEARFGWSSDDLGWDRPHPEIPTLYSADQTLLPGSLAFYAYRNRGRTWDFSEDLFWAHGRHLVQLGGGFLLRGIDGFLTAGRDGRFTFPTVLQFATGSPSEYSTVLDGSAFPGYRLPAYDRTYRYRQFHLFVQDTFRASRRLTLNYGLRYENFGAPSNTGAVKDRLFLPGDGITLAQRIAAARLRPSGPGGALIYRRDDRGWAVRSGLSYDLTGKGRSLLRGAYGIFYDRPFDNLWANVRLNGSVLKTFDVPADTTDFLSPALPQFESFIPQPADSGFPAVTWIDPSLRNAYVHSFFAGLRQAIAANLSLEVNGTGSLGRNLITTDVLNRGSVYSRQLPEILYRANQGSSDYSALTVLAKYRRSRAQFQASYTWSHSIDNQSSPLAGDFFDLAFVRLTSAQAFQPAAAFTTEQNGKGDRGNSDFDQRHNLVLMSIADLPGRAWPIRGWRVAALASFRTGFPYTVYAATSPSAMRNRRADLVNPSAAAQDRAAPGGRILLNAAAFADPAAGNGNLGRNPFVGPGLINIDLSLNRAVPLRWLGEAWRLHLRADAYNFLNHANLGNPYPQLASGTFGFAAYGRKAQPTGFPGLLPLNETARQVQLMVKLEW